MGDVCEFELPRNQLPLSRLQTLGHFTFSRSRKSDVNARSVSFNRD